MVSTNVSWNGELQIHFIDTSTTKVNADNYIKLLEEKLLPDCTLLCPRGGFIFQQDGAPSYTSHKTQAYLDDNTHDFIRKDEWPFQSPDQNTMDYAMGSSFQKGILKQRRKV